MNLFRGVSPEDARAAGLRRPGAPRRRWWPRAAPSTPIAGSTRCTRTSCGPGDPQCRSSSRSTASVDGRSFTTRRVVAIQHGEAIFNLGGVVPDRGPGPTTSDAMPEVADARDDPAVAAVAWGDAENRRDRVAVGGGAADRLRLPGRRSVVRAKARDPRIKTCGSAPTARCPTTRSSTRPSVAYVSDLALLDTTTLPHASPGRRASRSPASTT